MGRRDRFPPSPAPGGLPAEGLGAWSREGPLRRLNRV